jgi:PAS domain S-box-containing protein
MPSREFVWKALNDARQRQSLCVDEFRVVSGDEAVRWVAADAKFHYAATGDADRALSMAVEITDRERTEERLRESEETLACIISSSMDAIVAIDEEQRIVLFNTAAETVFGCARDEAIGNFINRFIPERFHDVHDGGIRPLSQTGINNRKTGTLNSMWAMRATGEKFPIEASVSQVETAGKKLFTAIIRDVSERHREQDAIRQGEERFRLVADSAPVLIWMSGPDKLRSYFDQAWLDFTGRPIEAELGNGWARGVHPDDLSLCLDVYKRAFDRSESFKMQYRLRRNDGEYRWIADIGVRHRPRDGGGSPKWSYWSFDCCPGGRA